MPLQDNKTRRPTRKGLPLQDMTPEQKRAAIDLLAASTSNLGKEQAVAEDRAQQAEHRCGAAVIVGVLDQDVTNPGGIAEDDLLAPDKAAGDRHLLEGAR